MNEIISELSELTAKGKVIHDRMADRRIEDRKDWRELAPILLRAKELVPHGQWDKYLEDNFPFIVSRTARRYMQAVREEKTLSQLTNEARDRFQNGLPKTDLSLAYRQYENH